MTTELGEFDLERDIETVRQEFKKQRERVYTTLLIAPPNVPAYIFDHAQRFLRRLDVEELKQLKAFREAYLSPYD
jgi:hypothetical protein